MFEYSSPLEALKKQTFSKSELKRHWYIFIMGTAVDCRRRGHARRWLTHVQNQAREDKLPIWLEATTAISRDMYTKYGFSSAGEAVLGKGKVDDKGLTKKGGEGVTIWSMYWRP
jgi:predicted acetyltransferase